MVKIKAIAVNPVDYKIRQNVSPAITGATIIATASRESSAAWVRELYRAACPFWQDCPDQRPAVPRCNQVEAEEPVPPPRPCPDLPVASSRFAL